ncbi:MAG: hypothetical protein ACTSVV_03725, partial [Promethearchaeota archaeon]
TSIFEFLASLPNGLLILLLSSGVIGGLWLIIGMVYLWQNGYYFVLIKIMEVQKSLSDNDDDEDDDSDE